MDESFHVSLADLRRITDAMNGVETTLVGLCLSLNGSTNIREGNAIAHADDLRKQLEVLGKTLWDAGLHNSGVAVNLSMQLIPRSLPSQQEESRAHRHNPLKSVRIYVGELWANSPSQAPTGGNAGSPKPLSESGVAGAGGVSTEFGAVGAGGVSSTADAYDRVKPYVPDDVNTKQPYEVGAEWVNLICANTSMIRLRDGQIVVPTHNIARIFSVPLEGNRRELKHFLPPSPPEIDAELKDSFTETQVYMPNTSELCKVYPLTFLVAVCNSWAKAGIVLQLTDAVHQRNSLMALRILHHLSWSQSRGLPLVYHTHEAHYVSRHD